MRSRARERERKKKLRHRRSRDLWVREAREEAMEEEKATKGRDGLARRRQDAAGPLLSRLPRASSLFRNQQEKFSSLF